MRLIIIRLFKSTFSFLYFFHFELLLLNLENFLVLKVIYRNSLFK